MDSAAPCPICSPPRQPLESLVRAESQSLFLSRMLIVGPRCFQSAPGHRCPDSSSTHNAPFLSSTPKVGRPREALRSRESGLCQQCPAESGLLWPYVYHHPFVSDPLSLPLRLLTFNHLLAIAELPPFPGECPISCSLLVLVSSSAQGHSCLHVSLTDAR